MTITLLAPILAMSLPENEVARRAQPKAGSRATPVSEGESCCICCRNKLITNRKPVNRHRAPSSGKRISVGKHIGEWVYEIFLTTLPLEGFLVEDVLDLYHGRGAFEAVLADEDVEEDPDRWCSHTECGQELWQIACQWIWNLRL